MLSSFKLHTTSRQCFHTCRQKALGDTLHRGNQQQARHLQPSHLVVISRSSNNASSSSSSSGGTDSSQLIEQQRIQREAKIKELADAIGISMHQANILAQTRPAILLQSSLGAYARARVVALGQRMGLPPAQAAQAARINPGALFDLGAEPPMMMRPPAQPQE